MKKRIAFLIMNMESGGGTERVTSVVANELKKRGYDISIISCQHGKSCRFPLSDDITLLSLNGERYKNGYYRKIKTISGLINIVKNRKIDIMIAVDVALYCYLYPLQLRKYCKCVAWEHFNYHITPNKLVKIGRKLSAEKADACIVLGKRDLESYMNNYKCKNVQYIYNPIALNRDLKADTKKKRIIAVGRLSYQKGFDLLIDAWNLLEPKYSDWKVDIFGEGDLKDLLQDKIEKYRLKNITLRGYAEDIEKEYVNSSIFVLPSRYEGFVLVLMEAQAKGLPCVSFDCWEGPAEIIDDGVNGYLVECENSQKLAEKIEILMKDENLRIQFAQKAQKDLGRFDTELIIDKWDEMLSSI